MVLSVLYLVKGLLMSLAPKCDFTIEFTKTPVEENGRTKTRIRRQLLWLEHTQTQNSPKGLSFSRDFLCFSPVWCFVIDWTGDSPVKFRGPNRSCCRRKKKWSSYLPPVSSRRVNFSHYYLLHNSLFINFYGMSKISKSCSRWILFYIGKNVCDSRGFSIIPVQ